MMSASPAWFSLGVVAILFFSCIVVGALLVARGLRGRLDLSEPHCGRCGYDLRGHLTQNHESRICPECGADLSKSANVHFSRGTRRPGLIMVGAILLILPVLGFMAWAGGGRIFRASGNIIARNAARTNTQLVSDLATTAGQPWTWQELERRYKSGRLSNADVSAAIDKLIVRIGAERRRNRLDPLPWSSPFLKLVDPVLSPQQKLRLYQAYYGSSASLVAQHPSCGQASAIPDQVGKFVESSRRSVR